MERYTRFSAVPIPCYIAGDLRVTGGFEKIRVIRGGYSTKRPSLSTILMLLEPSATT
jgi:hypothetical protein